MSDHSHDHEHHHHGHHHHHHDVTARMSYAFWLNFLFACVELVGGVFVNSLAIISDALHDFGDALAIGMAWYLEKKSVSEGGGQYSYGLRRLSTVSAVVTALILIFGSLIIVSETIPRLMNPQQPKVDGMIVLAILGVFVNSMAFLKMKKGKTLSERVLTWHFIEDILGWVLILFGAIFMKFYNFPIVDSVLALVISLWVLKNVYANLKEAMNVFLQAAPSGVSIDKVKNYFVEQSEVHSAHHLHLWSIDGESHILTVHLVLHEKIPLDSHCQIRTRIKSELKNKFRINEATIEIEIHGEVCFDPNHSLA